MGKNKELKNLSRKELLEILLEQTKRIEVLEKKLEDSDKKLESKKISLSETGTLAEAALKLSDIFKSADEAIEIYKLNIEESVKKEEKNFKRECRKIKDKIIADTEVKCHKKLDQIEKECEKRKNETEEMCKKIEEDSAKKVKDLENQIKELENELLKEKALKNKTIKSKVESESSKETKKVKDEKKDETVIKVTPKNKKNKRKHK
ncbi:MAG: hypothetical protein PUA90_05925 [bacterium]|nr:hypothetical protein [bacterium]